MSRVSGNEQAVPALPKSGTFDSQEVTERRFGPLREISKKQRSLSQEDLQLMAQAEGARAGEPI